MLTPPLSHLFFFSGGSHYFIYLPHSVPLGFCTTKLHTTLSLNFIKKKETYPVLRRGFTNKGDTKNKTSSYDSRAKPTNMVKFKELNFNDLNAKLAIFKAEKFLSSNLEIPTFSLSRSPVPQKLTFDIIKARL